MSRVSLKGSGQGNGAIDGRSDHENQDQAENGPPQNHVRRPAPLAKPPATLLPGHNCITDRLEVEDIAIKNGARMRERIARPARALPSDADRRERRRRWLFVLFVIALLVPGSFFVGTARLTPYRAFLLLAVLPLLWQVARGALGRLTAVDVFFVSYVLWLALATFVHEGMERYEFIVVLTIEALGGYLFGRVLVRNAADYKLLMRALLLGILIMVPFAVVEMLTRQNLASQIAGMVFEPHNQATHPPRLGFFRAQVSFEHPILYGLFCSLGFANAFYIYRLHRRKQLFWMGTSGFATFSALSSAPLLALLLQGMMILWDRIVRNLKAKWFVLAGLLLAIFGVLELATPEGAVEFLIANFTLVPATAEYRMMTNELVSELVLKFPLFGVPPGEFDLPWWHNRSVDNFWLVTASNYGIPTVLFLILAIVLHLFKVISAEISDEEVSGIRTGHLIAVAALIFLLTTVHIWGATSVMIMTYLGAGAWIYVPERTPAPEGRRRKRPEPASVAASPEPAGRRPPAVPRPATAGRVRGSTGRYGGNA